MEEHQKYIRRCLELAQLGLGSAAPNPLVGSVIVYKKRIIGEGYHKLYGTEHAEVNAVNSVLESNKKYLPDSTIYVNMEPCCIYGNTPPCTDLIIKTKIPKVVIANIDKDERVSGAGVQKLEKAGIQVTCGVLESEAKEINRRFFTYFEKQRPYIILKWAETKDGFIAKNDSKQHWISNPISKYYSHKWRTEESAILVGSNTVLIDDPTLTARKWSGKNPLRVSIDNQGKFPKNLKIFDDSAKTVIYSIKKIDHPKYLPIENESNSLKYILRDLHSKKVQSLIVEGGAKLLNAFVSKNYWDEARVFTGNTFFKNGIKAPSLQIAPISTSQIQDNQLSIYRNL